MWPMSRATARRPRAWYAARAATAWLVLGLVAAGCGGGSGPSEGPGDASRSESSEAPSAGSEPSPSAPTDSAGAGSAGTSPSSRPSSRPASFPAQRMSHAGLSVVVPRSWEVQQVELLGGGSASGSGEQGIVMIESVPVDPDAPGRPVDQVARRALATETWEREPERLPDVELLGVPMFHLRGPTDSLFVVENWGGVIDGVEVQIRITQPRTVPAAERRAFRDDVIGSLRRTG